MGRFYVELEGLSSSEMLLIRVLFIFIRKAQVPPGAAVINKYNLFTLPPPFRLAAVRTYVSSADYLIIVERNLCTRTS